MIGETKCSLYDVKSPLPSGCADTKDVCVQPSLSAVSSGFIKQESVPFEAFISNRFGQYYATGEESTDPEVRIETLTDFAS